MDLDDLLEEFKDDHKNQKAVSGAVKGAKQVTQQDDEWGAFGGSTSAVTS